MGIYVEKLDKGFVNARPPLTLEPGEFQDGTGLSYVPNNQALVRGQLLGTSANSATFGSASTTATPVVGISVLSFLNGPQYLLAATDQAGGIYSYRTSPTSAVNWTTLLSGVVSGALIGGPGLDVASYADRHYVFNGADTNRCIYQNGATLSIRRQGLSDNSGTPSVSLLDLGSTQGFGAATGTYEYWYTEVVKVSEGSKLFELESKYASKVGAVVSITTTSQVPVITRDLAFTNANVSFWRLYRGFRAVSSVSAYPVGVLIAELPVSVTGFANGTPTTLGPFRPTSAVTAGNQLWTNINGVTAGVSGDGVVANWIGSAGITQSGRLTLSYSSITGVQPPIAGIQVFVRDKRALGVDGITWLVCYLSGDNNITESNRKGVAYSSTNAYFGSAASSQYNLGGPGDLWGKPENYWGDSTLASGAFRVNLLAYNAPIVFASWDVDDVQVTLTQQGIETVKGPYPAYTISVDGNTQQGALLGQPPFSSTGDVFENSVVCNDVQNPSIFRYSLANQPEYFPDLYFGRLDGNKPEPITAIRTVGNRMIIATRSSLWRLNYLPRWQDSQFDRGRPLDLISSDIGISSVKGCALFTSQGDGRPMLAFFCDKGLFATDGYGVQQLSSDLDWQAILSGSNIASAATLVNNEQVFTLHCFYPSASNLACGQRLDFCYHPSHEKAGGGLKASTRLPISLTANYVVDACYANIPTGTTKLFAGTHQGYVQTLGAMPYGFYSVKTRRFYPGGFGNEARIRSVYVTRFDENKIDSGTGQLFSSASFTNRADVNPLGMTMVIPSGCRDTARFGTNLFGEQFQFEFIYTPSNATGASDGIVSFGLRGDDFGEEDSVGLS